MIRADSFLLHEKSKTPPEKGGVFTSLDGLRRIWTLSQLNKYTSEWATDPIGGNCEVAQRRLCGSGLVREALGACAGAFASKPAPTGCASGG
ncbi:hypothetical protein C5612_07220 [Pseudomonas frederiksbergensis]|uniref:Uncharacterized protein n=1 Tax=Pseudomonas frederiksbergensis TaxID=104087 RepID=A0A2S8HQ09_9PSED|nr:hypothetical protein C5612_07220 [Pseudomonas frederiksbergensis]